MCSINYQCSSLTNQKCQCKNRVTIEGGFCMRHSKKEASVIQIINSFNTITIDKPINSKNIIIQSKNTIIPENIFVNGKFIPNPQCPPSQLELNRIARAREFCLGANGRAHW